MKSDKFIWIGAPGVARNGKTLTPGQTYATADFPAEVVAEWIRTGHAKAAKPEHVPVGKSESKGEN